jgi:hypothetical protein
MCFIHYISAYRRLIEVEKTVTMLKSDKYSERDVPPMVLAQRDFIKKEKEYFEDVCYMWLLGILFVCMAYGFYWVLANKVSQNG